MSNNYMQVLNQQRTKIEGTSMRIEHFLQSINYQIKDCSNYLWKCFGENVRILDTECQNSDIGTSCIFDPTTRKIFVIEFWDEKGQHIAFDELEFCVCIDPNFREAYFKEYEDRNIETNNLIEISYEEILSKIRKAFKTETEEVNIHIDPDLQTYVYRLAHELNISFNEFVVEILRNQIKEIKND